MGDHDCGVFDILKGLTMKIAIECVLVLLIFASKPWRSENGMWWYASVFIAVGLLLHILKQILQIS